MTTTESQIAAALPQSAEPPPVAGEAIWFHEEEGARKGPLTEAKMIELIKNQTITGSTAIWKKGFPDWLKLENTDMKVHMDDKAPPPLSGEHVNNTIIWVLAFAPFIGYLLEYFLAGMLNGNRRLADLAMESSKYWYVTLALNIGLSYYDEHKLKLAGHDTSKFKGLAFIVPVYLYQRAQALKQNLAYFIVWIACFVVVLVS